jgi:hypothetical protein
MLMPIIVWRAELEVEVGSELEFDSGLPDSVGVLGKLGELGNDDDIEKKNGEDGEKGPSEDSDGEEARDRALVLSGNTADGNDGRMPNDNEEVPMISSPEPTKLDDAGLELESASESPIAKPGRDCIMGSGLNSSGESVISADGEDGGDVNGDVETSRGELLLVLVLPPPSGRASDSPNGTPAVNGRLRTGTGPLKMGRDNDAEMEAVELDEAS